MGSNPLVASLHESLENAHLDSGYQLNTHLLDSFSRHQSEQIGEDDRELLLQDLAKVLPVWSEDPQPLTELTTRLIEPPTFTFDRLCALQPLSNFIQGLTVPNSAVNLMTLAFLEKGSESLPDISKIAATPELVHTWVNLWLCTKDTKVSQSALNVLQKCLTNGGADGSSTPGRNLMVRRVFRDEDIYGLLFSIPDLESATNEGQLTMRQKTVAQGRLLEFVVNLDGSSSPARRSQIPAVEQRYDVADGGLLKYALCRMKIDKDDDLMLSVYLQACTRLLGKIPAGMSEDPDWPLEFLKSNRLHEKCLEYYLNHKKGYSSWLVSDSALYLAAYCEHWPEDFIKSKELCTETVSLIEDAFRGTSLSQWRSDLNLNNHLRVLGSLPKILDTENATQYTGVAPPLLEVPESIPSENIIITLNQVFCEAKDLREQAAARINYLLYIHRYPHLWVSMTRLADTVALTAPAIAAIRLMNTFVSTSWAPLPAEEDDNDHLIRLPTESELSERLEYENPSLPENGWQALFLDGDPHQHIIPFLLRPSPDISDAQTDTQSAAWKIATAKYDLMTNVYKKSRTQTRVRSYLPWFVDELHKRWVLGPAGGQHGIGGQIGTERQ